MNDFVEKLRLKEMAEEDIYFAQHDLELIEALHRKRLAKHAQCDGFAQKHRARGFEDRYAALANQHTKTGHKGKRLALLRGLRELLDEVWRACHKRS